MAFSIRKREEKKSQNDMGLLDPVLMQNLQDRFCDANNLYLVCLSIKHGVITKAYGSKEELQYIHDLVGMDTHVSLMNKIVGSNIESVVEENLGNNLVKMCGVSIRVSGEIAAIWIVIGIMEGISEEVPSYVMKTSPDRFFKSIEFLETLSKQMFAVKMEELLTQEAFLRSRESESQMEAELHRNEVMTSVVKMLESENGFTDVVNDILTEVCPYLGVSNCVLLREGIDGAAVDVLCEYAASHLPKAKTPLKGATKEELPFFNGKPYMISANSMMPEEFRKLFEREEIIAGIFLPIDVNGHNNMYLCLLEKEREKVWDVADIKFMNDVKRIIQTILHKRIAKNSLASSYASLEAILENVGCGIFVKDSGSKHILYANQNFREAFHTYIEAGALEKYFPNNVDVEVGRLHSLGEIYLEETKNWYDSHITRINWVDGKSVNLYTVYNVTDKKLYQYEIEKQANNDFLTGIHNRMRCERDLEHYIKLVEEFGGEGALLCIDLDDFKNINDALGHRYGDVLLKNVSTSFQKISGIENNCYRIGGDEFMIIVPQHSFMMLERIIDEIRKIFSRPWMLKGADYYCTMSMGVVKFPTDGDTVEELMKKADIALYDAKYAGKNRIAFYDENVEATSFKRLDLEKNMRDSTQSGLKEFEVYFQPIVDVAKDGMPCAGAEALVRWHSKVLGHILPTDFIPLAEYLGLVVPIGEHVLREACKRCKYWNDMGHPEYTVNVNLSVVQLLQNDIVDKVRNSLIETGLRPENLKLEVTESLAINDMDRMRRILAEIRGLGAKVALDDFGTGYSSLNHIREMPLDVIKIDRCFIVDIAKDEFSVAFVKMVVELANAIGVKVCVEGVETEEQLRILADCKVHYIQGYYFGTPMKAEEFEKKYL